MSDRDYLYDHNKHPFQPDATGYEKNNGPCLAAASNLAYESSPIVESTVPTWGFTSVKFVDGGKDTQAFVAANAKALLIIFRGTESIKDWMTNVRIKPIEGPAGEVHGGFYEAAMRVWHSQIKGIVTEMRTTGQPIWIAGHSLGGALAVLTGAIMQLDAENLIPVQGVCTFGQPRVGNWSFASAFDKSFKNRAYRLVNNNDIVPHVPPVGLILRYWHTKRMLYINKEGELKSAMPVWKRILEGSQGIFRDLAEPGVEAVKDHDMNNYVAATRKYVESGRTDIA